MSKRALGMLFEWMEAHRSELEENWPSMTVVPGGP